MKPSSAGGSHVPLATQRYKPLSALHIVCSTCRRHQPWGCVCVWAATHFVYLSNIAVGFALHIAELHNRMEHTIDRNMSMCVCVCLCHLNVPYTYIPIYVYKTQYLMWTGANRAGLSGIDSVFADDVVGIYSPTAAESLRELEAFNIICCEIRSPEMCM